MKMTTLEGPEDHAAQREYTEDAFSAFEFKMEGQTSDQRII